MPDPHQGYSFEEVVARELESYGYEVELTPKSRDFGADIIARKDGKKMAIQVKYTSRPVGVHAVQEVLGGKKYYRCKDAWIISTAGFTRQARELAKRSKVHLIEWSSLPDYIESKGHITRNYYRRTSPTKKPNSSRSHATWGISSSRHLTNRLSRIAPIIAIAVIPLIFGLLLDVLYIRRILPSILHYPPHSSSQTFLILLMFIGVNAGIYFLIKFLVDLIRKELIL
ncbi:restriction endonuclease [Thermococcus sp. 5-4]|uniref:restriction endonuclease n=1 Tax=Thermococcus sp. 5-4 TaxID=2008440 RepID=UPI001438A277|nr:restriction endonuclease [Thermococcus sp. 5-4]